MSRTCPTPPSLSYEIYPPNTPAAHERFDGLLSELASTAPDYVSVTSNGDAERRAATLSAVHHLVHHTRLRPLVHLTCVGQGRDALADLIRHVIDLGVRGVLALRGDRLPGPDGAPVPVENPDELPFARYLVELVREVEADSTATLAAGRLSVGVAAYPVRHPESPSFQHDVEVLLAKQRSGADYAITQVYFRPEDYTNLRRAAARAGVTIPLVPGLLPVDSPGRLARLCALTGVAPDPALAHALESARSPGERRRIGVDFASRLARTALDAGAPGIHVYTFNNAAAPLELVDALDLPRSRSLTRDDLAARIGA